MSLTAVADKQYVFDSPDRLTIEMPNASEKSAEGGKLGMFAEDGPSFWDVLDVVNPLQHIPIIGDIYREITGDKIGAGARLVGGALFGGPVGLVASAVDCLVQEESGKDIGGHVLALFNGDTPPDQSDTKLAEAPPSPPAAPAVVAAAEPVPPPPQAAPQAQVAVGPPPPQPVMPSGGMMFTTGGVVTPAATGGMATPAAAEAPKGPMPLLRGEPRFMPVPPRGAGVIPKDAPPPITVPISTGSNRTYAPITGHNPAANATLSPQAVQQLVAEQKAAAANPSDKDWFVNAMGSGLDKYEQAARLGAAAAPAPVAE